ncbi:MAG: Enterobactin exporter EntS [Phycisphaerales bacterium]|nr:Enterobactin exporter EntS [Phycisphaerales bacterium]
MHDPYAALRNRNYQRYAIGFFSGATGLQALGTAIGWEIYDRTGDALSLGLTGLARALPVVLLALPAGHAADTYDRRTIVVCSQGAFALCAVALAVVAWMHAPTWIIFAMLVSMGVARAFNGPARSSFLPTIVPMDIFHNAVAWTSSGFQLAAVVGPMVAGWIIHETGSATAVYLLAAVGNAVFAVTVTTITPLTRAAPSGKYTVGAMLAGMSHLWREKTILGAITLDLFAVLLGGATALMPIFAEDILDAGAVGLGALRAAPFVGAFLMGVYIAHRPPFKRSGRALLWSVIGFGIATIVFGFSRNLWLSLAMLVILGAVDNISVVIRHVLVQVRTPDHLRGRVGAVNSLFIECSNELGAFESGAVAKLLGPVFAVVSGGIGTILVALGVGASLPELRRLGELKEEPAKAGAAARPPLTTTTCSTCGVELPSMNEEKCPECGATIQEAETKTS